MKVGGVYSPVSVLLVDDHALLRETLSEWFRRDSRIRQVDSAASADEALKMCAQLRPDVVLMDIDMPGRNSFEAAREMKRLSAQTRIIFVSSFCSDNFIEQALQVEAAGYITKGEPPDALMEAIEAAVTGSVYFSADIQERLIIDTTGPRLSTPFKTKLSLLTRREREILYYVSLGHSKKEISKTLHISVKTVDRHTANLMQKLGIHDRVELARFAIREGISNT